MEFIKIRRILSYTRRAIDDYGMIEDGDRIAIGISGGKDSMTLLAALYNLKMFYPKKFDIVPITIDMGFEGMDFSEVIKFCDDLGLPLVITKTQISHIIFNIRKESNPCSLCARMRRGALHDTAISQKCNKIALGHHFDDVVNTFFLNLFHEGRLGAFSPVTYLSRKQITLIRPFIYVEESDIKSFIKRNPHVPVVKSTCPADKHTQREKINEFVKNLEKTNKGVRKQIFHALCKAEIDNFKLNKNVSDEQK